MSRALRTRVGLASDRTSPAGGRPNAASDMAGRGRLAPRASGADRRLDSGRAAESRHRLRASRQSQYALSRRRDASAADALGSASVGHSRARLPARHLDAGVGVSLEARGVPPRKRRADQSARAPAARNGSGAVSGAAAPARRILACVRAVVRRHDPHRSLQLSAPRDCAAPR